MPHKGVHSVSLGKGVSLTLFYGDVDAGLKAIEAAADAWFLDGFAPAKNPAMWAPDIMNRVARLSSPGASFSTFTVAGDVRRALAGAGFLLEKQPGYGKKREMLVGALSGDNQRESLRQPWFQAAPGNLPPGSTLAIIGGGIAGASLAFAARKANLNPVIIEQDRPAAGASGNPAGLIMPRLDVGDTPAGRFHASAYMYAVRQIQNLASEKSEAFFNNCGAVLHAADIDDEKRFEKLLSAPALPAGWIEKAADGIFFPQGGVIDPGSFVRLLIGNTPVRKARAGRIKLGPGLTEILLDDGAKLQPDAAVIANAYEARRFLQSRSLPLAGSVGQIDWFPAAPPPASAHAFGPYAAPAPNGGVVIGATYSPVTGVALIASASATKSNIAAVRGQIDGFDCDFPKTETRPRVSIRCTSPDRMPIVGPAPDWAYYAEEYDGLRTGKQLDYAAPEYVPNLYFLTGLGSRGLVTAPLAAAFLMAEITGAPSPVDQEVAAALHPARFFIRDLKRSQTRRK